MNSQTPAPDAHLADVFARLGSLAAAPAAELAARTGTVPLAVLDTNVVLDLWYWKDPASRELMHALRKKRITAVSTVSCLKELAVVLARPVFALTDQAQEAILTDVLACVRVVRASVEGLVRCRDGEDEKFLNLAYEVRADLLLTKDKRVLRAGRKLAARGTKTMRPADWDRAQGVGEVKPQV